MGGLTLDVIEVTAVRRHGPALDHLRHAGRHGLGCQRLHARLQRRHRQGGRSLDDHDGARGRQVSSKAACIQ